MLAQCFLLIFHSCPYVEVVQGDAHYVQPMKRPQSAPDSAAKTKFPGEDD